MAIPFIRSVEVGDEFSDEVSSYRVKPACLDKIHGHWYCVTCGKQLEESEFFRHVDEYIRRDHVITWVCWKHGPETP